jgi:hypothetical protein
MCRNSSILSLVLISIVIVLFLQTPCRAATEGRIKDIGILSVGQQLEDTCYFSVPFSQPPAIVMTPMYSPLDTIIVTVVPNVILNNGFSYYVHVGGPVGPGPAPSGHVWINWIACSIGHSGIDLNEAVTPSLNSQSQNSPNPSNGITKISYEITKQSFVTLKIYDISGNLIKTLMEGKQAVGKYAPFWMGDDNNGRKVSNGDYFYVLSVDGMQTSRKVIILK